LLELYSLLALQKVECQDINEGAGWLSTGYIAGELEAVKNNLNGLGTPELAMPPFENQSRSYGGDRDRP
jgi:hypothetical protein